MSLKYVKLHKTKQNDVNQFVDNWRLELPIWKEDAWKNLTVNKQVAAVIDHGKDSSVAIWKRHKVSGLSFLIVKLYKSAGIVGFWKELAFIC